MVAQFEFIPWILGQCASVKEALRLLEQVNLVNTPFSESLPLAQLHWILADREEAVTVESVLSGIHVYPNPAESLPIIRRFQSRCLTSITICTCPQRIRRIVFLTSSP